MEIGRAMDVGVDVDEPVACLCMARLVAHAQLAAQPSFKSLKVPRALGLRLLDAWTSTIMPLQADSFGGGFG